MSAPVPPRGEMSTHSELVKVNHGYDVTVYVRSLNFGDDVETDEEMASFIAFGHLANCVGRLRAIDFLLTVPCEEVDDAPT